MKWIEAHIDTSPAGLEPAADMLSTLGIEGLVIEDEGDFRRFLEENRQYWDYVDEALDQAMAGKCRITFTAIAAVRIAMAELKKAHPDYAPLLLTLDGIEDADWENNWRAYYKPMEIGERLLVIPDWETAETGDRVALRLEPGLTFGTGSHATTRLCLTALERIVRPGMRMLDLGCGSGILSIAALLLGAETAFACDIDEKAVGIAYQNAALNGVGRERYTVRAGDILSDIGLQREMGSGYDVIAANIVADVIIALAPAARPLLAPGGYFLCSGIIEGREAEVREALEAAGFTVEEAGQSEGWHSLLCR